MGSSCSIKSHSLKSLPSIEDEFIGAEGYLQDFGQTQIQNRSCYSFDNFEKHSKQNCANQDSFIDKLVKNNKKKNFIEACSNPSQFKTQILQMIKVFDNKTKELNRIYTQYRKQEDEEINISFQSFESDYARQISEVCLNEPGKDFPQRQRSQSALYCSKGILKNGPKTQKRKKSINGFTNQDEGFKIVRFQLPQQKGRSMRQKQRIATKKSIIKEKLHQGKLEAQQTQKSLVQSPSPQNGQNSSSMVSLERSPVNQTKIHPQKKLPLRKY